MKKITYILVLILILGNCKKNNEQKNDQFEVFETSSQMIFFEENQNASNKNLIDVNSIIGTYLTVGYLDELHKTRSHIHSIRKTILDDEIDLVEIIISEDNITFIFNLHEGVGTPIIDVKDHILSFETGRRTPTEFANKGDVLIKDDGHIVFDNIIYKKVTNDSIPGPRGKSGVKKYITDVIFGNSIYYNNNSDELFRLENGNISYKNEEYELSYGWMFQNQERDTLNLVQRTTKNWHEEGFKYTFQEDYWIEINGNEISLFTLIMPENPDDLDEIEKWADFEIIDVLRRL
jgi:hypothetical protein